MKETLVRKLRAIQDLKEENPGLVGTQDIWTLLKDQQETYETPAKISDAVNKKIRKFFSEPTYLASPERIVGIDSCLNEASIDASLEYHMQDNYGFNDYLVQKGANLFNFEEIFVFTDSSEKINSARDYFLNFFLEINNDKISKDEEIYPSIISLLQEQYNSVEDKVDEEFREDCEKYLQTFFEGLYSADWKYNLSRKHLASEESVLTKRAFRDAFNIRKMSERVIREKVEHRRDYRLGILSHAIDSEFMNLIPLEILNVERTWQNLVEEYDSHILISKMDLVDLVKLGNREELAEDSSVLRSYKLNRKLAIESGEKPPRLRDYVNEETAKTMELLEDCKFIKSLLHEERRWVEKALRS